MQGYSIDSAVTSSDSNRKARELRKFLIELHFVTPSPSAVIVWNDDYVDVYCVGSFW